MPAMLEVIVRDGWGAGVPGAIVVGEAWDPESPGGESLARADGKWIEHRKEPAGRVESHKECGMEAGTSRTCGRDTSRMGRADLSDFGQ